MGRLWMIAVACLLTVVMGARAETLIDTDFGETTTPVQDISPDGAKSLTGRLPAGWTENSGWNKEIVATYEPREEEGRRFLRVTKKSGGTCQLAFYLADIPRETFFRLEFTARSAAQAGVTIGLRDAGPPYAFHWSIQPPLTAQWQNFVYEFRIDPQPQRVGLWINLSENVSYDIAHVRLIARGREEIIAELKTKYPDTGPKNLVRVSVFLRGLPTGWALDRDNSDGDDVVIMSEAKTKTPSGAPPLVIRSARAWRLWTAPVFIPRSFERHTASLFARGEGKLRLTAFGDGQQLQSAETELAPQEWRRVTLTFMPVLQGRMHQLAIDGRGNVLLDAFQIERGEQATSYAPPVPCQIAFALPPTQASAARIQFADEPPLIRYAVFGAPAGSILKLRQYDLYGHETPLPQIKLLRPEGTFRLLLAPRRALGAFRVEGHIEDGQGRPISLPEEIVVYRLQRPRYWKKPALRSPFGVHTNSTTRHILMAKAIGANWARLHDAGTQYIGWAHLEPEPGKWIFYDTELKRYGRYNLHILGLLSTSPLWANYGDKPRNSYFDRYIEPKDFAQFAHYVRVVTERYKSEITAYDIWNEPWGTSFWSLGWDEEKKEWKRSPTAAADYARLQKIAYETAKAVDPTLTILGFNTYGAANGREWTAQLMQLGAWEACDAICYHHYSPAYNGFPGDDVSRALQDAIAPIIAARGNVGKPVWMTEGSPNIYQLNNGFYHHVALGQPLDDNWGIANRLSRYLLSLLAQGVAKIFVYTMHAHGPFKPTPEPWRVLVEDDGFLHPSGAAYAHLAWLLEDTRFVKTLEPAPGVFAYLFEGAGHAVAALSSRPEHAAYAVPAAAGIQATDLFGNPVAPDTPIDKYVVYLQAKQRSILEHALASGAK